MDRQEYINDVAERNPDVAAALAKVGTTEPERITVTPEQYLDFLYSRTIDAARIRAREAINAAPLPMQGKLYFSHMLARFETDMMDAVLATDKEKVYALLPDASEEVLATHKEAKAIDEAAKLVAEVVAEQIARRKEGPVTQAISQGN